MSILGIDNANSIILLYILWSIVGFIPSPIAVGGSCVVSYPPAFRWLTFFFFLEKSGVAANVVLCKPTNSENPQSFLAVFISHWGLRNKVTTT